MTRRTCVQLAAGALAACSVAEGKDESMYQGIFEASQNEKKGLMLYVKGQQIAGIVVKIGSDHVEMRSREYARIIVRIESIDAAALS